MPSKHSEHLLFLWLSVTPVIKLGQMYARGGSGPLAYECEMVDFVL